MKGDFTRNTFDPRNHYARVLMQQGRVQLDADWNEQSAIQLYYLHRLAADLIGPFAGPRNNLGFGIDAANYEGEDFAIGNGRYYVQGYLCENDILRIDSKGAPIPVTYLNQPDYPNPPDLPAGPFLVYLDVWERHLSYIQAPEIREVALGGPDTGTRSKIIWQVKAQENVEECPNAEAWRNLEDQWQPENRGLLRAGVKQFEADSAEPCTISPESKYRGAENQLYRVEIQNGGPVGDATFKWSRENGSVIFPILKLQIDVTGNTTTVWLEHLGRDERFTLQEGNWVEVSDDAVELKGRAVNLLKVIAVDRVQLQVTLSGVPNITCGQDPVLHPLLRRWDHQELDPILGYPQLAADGALVLEEKNWLVLEDGIQVYFDALPAGETNTYRTGDYWLIPARTATGDVEWPGEPDAPEALPPLGIQHYYAPLAVLVERDGGVVSDCRRRLIQLWEEESA
jgi:hypothetical protein